MTKQRAQRQALQRKANGLPTARDRKAQQDKARHAQSDHDAVPKQSVAKKPFMPRRRKRPDEAITDARALQNQITRLERELSQLRRQRALAIQDCYRAGLRPHTIGGQLGTTAAHIIEYAGAPNDHDIAP